MQKTQGRGYPVAGGFGSPSEAELLGEFSPLGDLAGKLGSQHDIVHDAVATLACKFPLGQDAANVSYTRQSTRKQRILRCRLARKWRLRSAVPASTNKRKTTIIDEHGCKESNIHKACTLSGKTAEVTGACNNALPELPTFGGGLTKKRPSHDARSSPRLQEHFLADCSGPARQITLLSQ